MAKETPEGCGRVGPWISGLIHPFEGFCPEYNRGTCISLAFVSLMDVSQIHSAESLPLNDLLNGKWGCTRST